MFKRPYEPDMKLDAIQIAQTDGSLVPFNPKYEDDWLHESVFKICNNQLANRKIRMVDFLYDDTQKFGQVIAMM